MRTIFLALSLSLLLTGCGHFCPLLCHEHECPASCSSCTTCTPCPAPTVPSTTIACPTPRVEVQPAPTVTVQCPAPQVQFLPAPQPVAPAAAFAPAFQPYAQPQPLAFAVQPPSAQLALLLDWISVPLPLLRLGTVPAPPVFTPVPVPQMLPAYYPQPYAQPLMQPAYAPPQPLYAQPAPQPVPQALILSVTPQPAVALPAVAQPTAGPSNVDLCKQLEQLKAAIEANQRAAGCGK